MPNRECLPRLTAIGISYPDAIALRRIAMTLHRWHELECGTDRGAIERDESTGNPYFVRQGNYGWSVWCLADDGAGKTRASRKTFPTKDAAIEYMLTVAPSREPEIRQVLYRRFPVPDRETGALKRLAAIMARYPQLSAYVQGDPRGAALYILRPGDVPEGGQADAYYSRGIAVYR